jgi:para-nitrobenzyl esterase
MANDVATTDAGLAPIVEIAAGKLRGASSAGICSFRGIPYGAPTVGRGRFMPPGAARPWSGVREAIAYALRAWQLPNRPKRRPVLETLLGPADTSQEGEDCLTLNVWTPGLGDGAKRPVMVWGCTASPLATARAIGS